MGTVERSRQKYKAAPLTVEFVPFFYRKCLAFHSSPHSHSLQCTRVFFRGIRIKCAELSAALNFTV